MHKKLAGILVLVMLLVGVVSGCQTEKKPVQPSRNSTGGTGMDPAKLSSSEKRILTDRFSNIANTVKGVQKSTVILSSDNKNQMVILAGLTLTSQTRSKEQEIKKTVAEKIKNNDQRVSEVLVTTDPNMIKRMSDIAAGIIEGKPIKSYARDVNELKKSL